MTSDSDKKTLREIVACAISAGFNTDGVAAMAFSDQLGGMLLRLKYANDARCHLPAVALTVRRMRQRKGESRGILNKIAIRAVREYLDDNCNHCGGRGMVYSMNRPVHVCVQCGGARRKHHQDQERARDLGVSIERYAKLSARFGRAAEIISNADSAVARDIARQLSGRM